MRTSVSSMIAATTIPLIAFVAYGAEPESSAGGVSGALALETKSLDELIDGLSEFKVRDGDEIMRDRLAAGILKWQTVKNHNGERIIVWNECGRRIEKKEAKEAALEWAYHLIRAANNSEKLYGWRINLWGVMGTIANESNFDRCAIGRHTREWAYKKKLLKPKKYTWISHSKKDILHLINSRRWSKEWKWVDAGPLQVLWKRIYKGPLEDMITLNPGLDIGIQEMQRRTNHFQSYVGKKDRRRLRRVVKRSWRMWPGAHVEDKRATKYDEKVTKYARKMGALRTEI